VGFKLEAVAAEDRGVIGEMADAQASEQGEGAVESGDDQAGGEDGEAGTMSGDLEFGDEPAGVGGTGGDDDGGEALDLGRGEAVEEEMGDDEVVGGAIVNGGGARVELERIEAMGAHAGGGAGAGDAAAEQSEHTGAGVDSVGVKLRVETEKAGEETAVAIAEDESAAGAHEMRQLSEAAAGKVRTEAQVFEPAVRAGDQVEVGRWNSGAGNRRVGHGLTSAARAAG